MRYILKNYYIIVMNRRNPIVYFEEDDIERITNGWGKILDMTPKVNVRGYVESIDLETEKMNGGIMKLER